MVTYSADRPTALAFDDHQERVLFGHCSGNITFCKWIGNQFIPLPNHTFKSNNKSPVTQLASLLGGELMCVAYEMGKCELVARIKGKTQVFKLINQPNKAFQSFRISKFLLTDKIVFFFSISHNAMVYIVSFEVSLQNESVSSLEKLKIELKLNLEESISQGCSFEKGVSESNKIATVEFQENGSPTQAQFLIAYGNCLLVY